MNRDGFCWRCESPCAQRCSRCRVAFYCSKRCQKRDKWRHKPDCDAAALKRKCMGCHEEHESMQKCTSCLRAWYCSKECQRKEWENHKNQCHEIVKKTIQLATQIKRQRAVTRQFPGLTFTYYWGNLPAVDLLNLPVNEGEDYQNPLALLLCGVGDPRNVLLTIASLPDVYEQKVTFVLNDICPCTLARTVLLLYMVCKGGSEAVDTVIRIWYSLRISEHDYSQLMSALEELVASQDLKSLTSGFMDVAAPDQLSDLKKVWRTWTQLSTLKGRWLTDRREAAFKRDVEVETVIGDYLMAVPQNHRNSVQEWRAEGLFRVQCEAASSLTRENATFTGFCSFQNEKNRTDYDFSPRPCVLPFTGWDYLEVKKTNFDDSLPKMYGVYISKILHKCIERLSKCEVKLHILLCNCLQIEPFLPLSLSYDRISTSNLCDYFSFTTMLTQVKGYLNPNNSHSVLITESFNWLDGYLPETSQEISKSSGDLTYTEIVLRDTNNPLLFTIPTSYIEYHNLIPDFQLYLRAALFESHSDEELRSLAKKNKLPSIKAIISALGLELRDYARNENKVFPFKWAVNCRRVTRMKGYEFALEWRLASPIQ